MQDNPHFVAGRQRKAASRAMAKIWRLLPCACVSVQQDGDGFCARIELENFSWCSTRGETRVEALENCLALALEPAPGFPGWIEPAPIAAVDELDEGGSP